MKYNISKELFESVIGESVVEYEVHEHVIKYYPLRYTRIRSLTWKPILNEIDINDFFFKCKKWAKEQGYYLSSTQGYKDNIIDFEAYLEWYSDDTKYRKEFYEDYTSEQQAVFDACQWILDNKGLK